MTVSSINGVRGLAVTALNSAVVGQFDALIDELQARRRGK